MAPLSPRTARLVDAGGVRVAYADVEDHLHLRHLPRGMARAQTVRRRGAMGIDLNRARVELEPARAALVHGRGTAWRGGVPIGPVERKRCTRRRRARKAVPVGELLAIVEA